jgi:hypothetical protein
MLKNYFKRGTLFKTENFWFNNLKNHLAIVYILIFGLFGMANVFGQTTNTFTTSSSWTAPAGVTSIQVEAWGAGGAGGNGGSSNKNAGGGGGGGGYSKLTSISVTPGNVYTITVGTGGTVSGTVGANGGNGNASTATFGSTTITANGGNGGSGHTNGATGGNGGAGNLFAGGNGANGNSTSGVAGGGGEGAGTTANGGNASGCTGGSGTDGGNGASYSDCVGGNSGSGTSATTASGYGGGGSGSVKNFAAGGGAAGAIKITFTCPSNTPSAGSNQTLAACAATTTLAGSAVPTGMTGLWTIVSGTATITTPNSPTSGVTGLTVGATATLRWTISNGACGSASSDVTITTVVGPSCLNYCASSGGAVADGITGVNFNTINNLGTTVTTAYQDFTAISTTVTKGSSYNLNVYINTGGNYTNHQSAYIDWNGDGDFVDTGEFYSLGTATNVTNGLTSLSPLSIAIPMGAITGTVRMRIQSRYNAATTGPCQTGFDGEVEDYTINIIDAVPCASPTAQPTALNLTPSGNSISGAFTAASPTADNYLVIASTNPAPPAAPVNGTSYAIGGTYQTGYTVVDNDTNTNFNATGLTVLTTYYFYIYSFNSLCAGGPSYLGTSPLTGNTTTLNASYCTPSSSINTRYIVDVFTTGNITNLSNLGTGYSPTGYADYTALPPVTQIPGGGVAIDYYLQSSRQNVKIWVDWNNDGVFTDAAPELVYQTGGTVTIAGAGGFIVPPATTPGNYRIRIRTRNEGESAAYGPCGLLNSGETEDYTLIVVADCTAKPNVLHDGERCGTGTVVLGVEGTSGVTEFRFYNSQFGGTLIGAVAATGGITNWTTPSLTATTSYFVTAFNGVCESWYRQEIVAEINPVANVVVTPSVPDVCGENNIVEISAGGDFIIDYLVNENFEGGGYGVLSLVNVAANANTQWTNRTGPYIPEGSVWKPAITSKAIGNRFVLANSDFGTPNPKDTQLRTAVLDASTFTDLYLDFRHYFSYYVGESLQFADVDVSTDGGTAWTNVARYTSTQGFAGEFANVTLNLSAYAGQSSVMIRFRYHLQGSAFCDGWVIDDVKVYGTRPLNTTFTWSGATVDAYIDADCTIPYVAQSVTTVYVKPTAMQLASPSWSFTATATLGNGCPISEFVTITNSTKLWKGTVSDDWYDPNNWEPVGVPDINTCIFVYDGPFVVNMDNTINGYGKTLTVRPNGVLQILPNKTLTIDQTVTVDAGGTFIIENSGSLIQNADVINTGIVTMRRDVNIRKLDYVYWSSPMSAFALSNVSPETIGNKWKWEPTLASTVNNHGNWVAANETMTRGKGYIVRGPNDYTTTLQNFTANFVGTPNNGTITMPVMRGTYDGVNYNTGLSATLATKNDDNWNLLGNPYPSAISADAFLGANANLAGFIKLWTHGTLPSGAVSDPFYETFTINYTVADYITYNALGGTQSGFDGSIAAGQGFFALMNHTSASTTENVTFNNTMRSNTYRNDLFYRNSNVVSSSDKSRIWLNLVSPTSLGSTTLIGYAPEATNGLDRLFDAPAMDVKTNYELYSLSNSDKLCIQGRALPFDQNDEIPLGMKIATNGSHTIAISKVDGLFADEYQTIYLEDKLLNVIHDLRAVPYHFTTTTGIHDTRFVLKYNNETLGNEDFITTNGVTVYTNNTINVTASSNIKSVTVYDVLGRTLETVRNVNNTNVSLNGIAKTQSALVVIVELENNVILSKKIIF